MHERRRWFGLPPTKAEGQVTWITHRLDTTYLLPCRPRWASTSTSTSRPGFSPTHPPPARREEKRTKSAVAYQPTTTTRSLKGFHTRGTSTIKRETNEREENLADSFFKSKEMMMRFSTLLSSRRTNLFVSGSPFCFCRRKTRERNSHTTFGLLQGLKNQVKSFLFRKEKPWDFSSLLK